MQILGSSKFSCPVWRWAGKALTPQSVVMPQFTCDSLTLVSCTTGSENTRPTAPSEHKCHCYFMLSSVKQIASKQNITSSRNCQTHHTALHYIIITVSAVLQRTLYDFCPNVLLLFLPMLAVVMFSVCMFVNLCVHCLSVCLSAGYLKKLLTNFDEFFVFFCVLLATNYSILCGYTGCAKKSIP